MIRRQRAHKLLGKAYKFLKINFLLVTTHEHCALITSAIQTQGEMECQLDELTDKIELETQKGVDAQLERLLDDLMIIRSENRELELKMATLEENREEQEEDG
jgi:transposase